MPRRRTACPFRIGRTAARCESAAAASLLPRPASSGPAHTRTQTSSARGRPTNAGIPRFWVPPRATDELSDPASVKAISSASSRVPPHETILNPQNCKHGEWPLLLQIHRSECSFPEVVNSPRGLPDRHWIETPKNGRSWARMLAHLLDCSLSRLLEWHDCAVAAVRAATRVWRGRCILRSGTVNHGGARISAKRFCAVRR